MGCTGSTGKSFSERVDDSVPLENKVAETGYYDVNRSFQGV